MARSRNIKPGFFKNEELAECSFEARLLFAGLWLLADREGRLEDRPKRIKGELFAFDSVEVEPLLSELAQHQFIQRYEPNYIQIANFTKHQAPHIREVPSVIPPPPKPVPDPPATGAKPGAQPPSDDTRAPTQAGAAPHSDGTRAPTQAGASTGNAPADPSLQGGSAPPDSLIPDSLNPDPGFLTPSPPTAAPRRRSAAKKAASVSSADADSSAKPTVPCPYKEIYALYHAKLPELPRVTLTDNEPRHKAMRKFWAFVLTSKKSDGTRRAETPEQALQWIGDYFERASTNDWLMGRDPSPGKHANWRATFDFLLTERGMKHVIENTRAPRGETG